MDPNMKILATEVSETLGVVDTQKLGKPRIKKQVTERGATNENSNHVSSDNQIMLSEEEEEEDEESEFTNKNSNRN